MLVTHGFVLAVITLHQQTLLGDGSWATLVAPVRLAEVLTDIRGDHNFTKCPVEVVQADAARIDFHQLKGLLFISGVGVCIGLVISMYERGQLYVQKTKERVRDIRRDVVDTVTATREKSLEMSSAVKVRSEQSR